MLLLLLYIIIYCIFSTAHIIDIVYRHRIYVAYIHCWKLALYKIHKKHTPTSVKRSIICFEPKSN